MQTLPTIPKSVARKLGYYVYLYVNPLDGAVFYIGKGKGKRALAHVGDAEKREVAKIIKEIRSAGGEPTIEILAHGLPDSASAFRIEGAAIDLVGLPHLANAVRGWHSAKFGRMPLDQVVAHYSRKPARITEPCILIRINRLYRYGITPVELYDATRGAWRIGKRRDKAEYALAVFEGIVREVYRITGWFPAGSTFSTRHDGKGKSRPGRWEFVGTIADEPVRQRYVNRDVSDLFSSGAQNPIAYVNL